jgi:diguanylate cyclase (GGDEF)-like protein/PAS domain S-box-containing protein
MSSEYNFHKILLENLLDAVYFVDRDRVITFWNKTAETITGYRKSDVGGRHCWDNILRHIDDKGNKLCMSSCPLTEAIQKGDVHQQEIYLQHRDGHRVPVLVRVVPIRDGKDKITGAVEIFNDNSSNLLTQQKMKELARLAYADPVTNLFNKNYIQVRLETNLFEMKTSKLSFGIILVQIKDLKDITARFGEELTNQFLKTVAKTLAGNTVLFDMIGRWDFDRFLGIVSNLHLDQLQYINQKTKALIEHTAISVKNQLITTHVAIGKCASEMDDTVKSLVQRVELNLL